MPLSLNKIYKIYMKLEDEIQDILVTSLLKFNTDVRIHFLTKQNAFKSK